MHPPYGFEWGRYGREPISHEQETLRRAYELRGQGYSIRSIALLLTDEGHTNREGGPIHATSVALWLKRKNAG